jgi:cell division protein FtsN
MTTRIVPSHVYEKQRAARGVRVPEGYEAAWDDGRLNPRRAHQSPAGRTKMQAVWTDTVPRRLVDPRTGQDVTHKYPGLQYPDTSHAAQRAAGGTVATQGRVPKTTQRTAATRDIPARATVSTRSEPAQKMARNASHRYVQAAVYSDRAQAKRAARRLAGTGLPARIGRLSRNGKSYTVVLAGPFRTQPKLDTAMRRVRGAGFSNARLRK